MPRFDYECLKCSFKFEVEKKMSEIEIEVICKECGSKEVKKLISRSGSFILKGPGWFNSGGY